MSKLLAAALLFSVLVNKIKQGRPIMRRLLMMCAAGIALMGCQPSSSDSHPSLGVNETAEENKRIVRRHFEAMNERDWTSATALFSDHYVWHGPGGEEGRHMPGVDPAAAAKADVAADPDFRWEIEDLIAEGDKVAFRLLDRGTHIGEPLFGVAPKGKPFTVRAMIMLRVEDGKIVEEWDSYDHLSNLRELGASKAELEGAVEQYYRLTAQMKR